MHSQSINELAKIKKQKHVRKALMSLQKKMKLCNFILGIIKHVKQLCFFQHEIMQDTQQNSRMKD